MTTAFIVVSAVALLAALMFHVAGDIALRSRTKRRCLVTTDAGTWFSGVLMSRDRRCVVLASVSTEAEDGSTATVDGEVLVLMDDIAHIQFP